MLQTPTNHRSPEITSSAAPVPDEQHVRLEVKLRRELGDQVLALLDDVRTEDILLNPDSSLWVKRMGEGFCRVGHMPPAQAFSVLSTIAAWRGTVVNHQHPILETELPLDGSRFEGIVPPVVASVSSARARPVPRRRASERKRAMAVGFFFSMPV